MVGFWFWLIVYLALGFLGLNFIFGVLQFNKVPKSYKALISFVFVASAVELLSKALIYFDLSNIHLLHAYTLLEFFIISIFFREIFHFGKFKAIHFNIFIVIICLLIAINSIFIQPLDGFNTNAKIIVSMIICTYSIIYFQQQLLREKNKQLNLVSASMLIYYSGSLLVFAFGGMVKELSQSSAYLVWSINAILNVIFNAMIFYVLCSNYFKKTNWSV